MNCRYCGGKADDEYCFNVFCPYDDKIIRENCDGKLSLEGVEITDFEPKNPRDLRGPYINYCLDQVKQIAKRKGVKRE